MESEPQKDLSCVWEEFLVRAKAMEKNVTCYRNKKKPVGLQWSETNHEYWKISHSIPDQTKSHRDK